MQKTLLFSFAVLLAGCAADGRVSENLAREIVSPLVDQQCRTQLNKRQEWQIASALMGNEVKNQWENKICGCVSEEAPANMTNQEILQVINPATRDQAVANVAVKTVSACIKRILH
jgi:lipoprotein